MLGLHKRCLLLGLLELGLNDATSPFPTLPDVYKQTIMSFMYITVRDTVLDQPACRERFLTLTAFYMSCNQSRLETL